MASTASPAAAPGGAPNGDKVHKTRPEKPDEGQYKEELARAEKEHSAAQEKLVRPQPFNSRHCDLALAAPHPALSVLQVRVVYHDTEVYCQNAIKSKLELARPQNKDSPASKRQAELRQQLSEIRKQQSSFKSSRGSTHDRIAALDAQLKSRIAEQKTARSRVPFKNVEEVDSQIKRLESQVDSGNMKLVDEKKALAEISSLRKQRKGFSGFEESEKAISDVKSQISELRKTLDNPEAKALSEKYNGIAKELDGIKAEQDDAFKGLNSLRDERTKLQAEQSAKYAALKEVKDKYYQANRAHRDYENELWRQKQERAKAERDAQAKEKRKKAAAQRLEEASAPAYMDEILTAEGLIRYFDPDAPVESKNLREPSGFAAVAQRTVDAAPMKGTALSKKEDREDMYFMGGGGGGKKGKKGKKGSAATSGTATPAESKFQLSVGIYEQLDKVKVDAPASQADVPVVLEKLKEKVGRWKADQDKKTKEVRLPPSVRNQARADVLAERRQGPGADRRPRARGAAGGRERPAGAALAKRGQEGGPGQHRHQRRRLGRGGAEAGEGCGRGRDGGAEGGGDRGRRGEVNVSRISGTRGLCCGCFSALLSHPPPLGRAYRRLAFRKQVADLAVLRPVCSPYLACSRASIVASCSAGNLFQHIMGGLRTRGTIFWDSLVWQFQAFTRSTFDPPEHMKLRTFAGLSLPSPLLAKNSRL